jgi:hypothetical protein
METVRTCETSATWRYIPEGCVVFFLVCVHFVQRNGLRKLRLHAQTVSPSDGEMLPIA